MHYHELTEDDRQDVDDYFAGREVWELLTSAARRYLTADAHGEDD